MKARAKRDGQLAVHNDIMTLSQKNIWDAALLDQFGAQVADKARVSAAIKRCFSMYVDRTNNTLKIAHCRAILDAAPQKFAMPPTAEAAIVGTMKQDIADLSFSHFC